MQSKAKSILSFISTFVVTVIVIIAAALLAAKLFGLQGFTVESNSMAPAYPVDSFIFVKETAPGEIQTGDVVTYVFNENGLLVTHRVVSVDSVNQTFVTKGDNNNVADPAPVMWGNVVGKVVFGVPRVGAVMRVLMTDENKPYVFTAIAIIGIASVILDLIEKKKLKSENEVEMHEEK